MQYDWIGEARLILKGELGRKGLTYKELSLRLELLGVRETESSIQSKLSRGSFSFVFFLQCMTAAETTAPSMVVSFAPQLGSVSELVRKFKEAANQPRGREMKTARSPSPASMSL